MDLKRVLKEKGMTQNELAKLSNVSTTAISRYCNGDRVPNADILCRMASALNVSVDVLIGGPLDNLDVKSLNKLSTLLYKECSDKIKELSKEETLDNKLLLVVYRDIIPEFIKSTTDKLTKEVIGH